MNKALENFSERAATLLLNPAEWPVDATRAYQDLKGKVKFAEKIAGFDGKCWNRRNSDYKKFRCFDRYGLGEINSPSSAWVEKETLFPRKKTKKRRVKKVEPHDFDFLTKHFSPEAVSRLLDFDQWPEGALFATQDIDGVIKFCSTLMGLIYRIGEYWERTGSNFKHFRYTNIKCADKPKNPSKACISKDALFKKSPTGIFIESGLGKTPLRYFSAEARGFLSVQTNWLEGAVWAVQDADGFVKFCEHAPRAANSYWARDGKDGVPDKFCGVFAHIVVRRKPKNWSKAIVRYDELFPETKPVITNDVSGCVTGRFTVEPDLPTLISSGAWWPIHNPPLIEIGENKEYFDLYAGGLRDRSITPQVMRELIMKDQQVDRLKATHMHNQVADICRILVLKKQNYEWKPNE